MVCHSIHAFPGTPLHPTSPHFTPLRRNGLTGLRREGYASRGLCCAQQPESLPGFDTPPLVRSPDLPVGPTRHESRQLGLLVRGSDFLGLLARAHLRQPPRIRPMFNWLRVRAVGWRIHLEQVGRSGGPIRYHWRGRMVHRVQQDLVGPRPRASRMQRRRG
jgi:hypothetical protein